MKYFKIIFLLACTGSLLAISCNKKIQDLQPDPNNPTSVTPNLILGTVLTDISGTGSAGTLGGINSWGEVSQWDQYFCQNYNYYGNNMYSWASGSFDPYLVMKNVVQMDEEALKTNPAVNPYEAVGRFIMAYYYYNLTSMFGDVPQAEALNGFEDIEVPYTSQKQVFQYILNTLDTANTELATLIAQQTNTASLFAPQDIYFNGDLTKWQKTVNAFRLRVLISLSKKSTDADLQVATQFANIINNPAQYPIYADTTSDLQFVYNPGGTNTYSTYPLNISNFGSIAQRINMAYTYVNALTTLNDPRVFVTCEPAWSLVPGLDTTPVMPAQYQYFAGASTGLPVGTMYSNAGRNMYSFINVNRYFSNFTGEPDVLVGYKEMCFNIAEAIARGWVSGNAETWYKAGIGSSMHFYGIDTAQTNFTAYFAPRGTVTPYPYTFSFSNYYNQSSVKLASDMNTAISQIVLQKYIACFQNSGYEGYYNWRRVGSPVFQDGSGVGNNGVIPVRWGYPVSEQTQNAANWKAALSNQGFSADDMNQVMWLIQ